jgi:hypothetical protein
LAVAAVRNVTIGGSPQDPVPEGVTRVTLAVVLLASLAVAVPQPGVIVRRDRVALGESVAVRGALRVVVRLERDNDTVAVLDLLMLQLAEAEYDLELGTFDILCDAEPEEGQLCEVDNDSAVDVVDTSEAVMDGVARLMLLLDADDSVAEGASSKVYDKAFC